MSQGSELPLLASWQSFYILVGTAAATLTGLMFVATTLVAGIDTHASTASAGVAGFNTPTVVHFCAVLLLAGILSAPWQSFSIASILLGLLGLGMVLYLIVIFRRLRQMPHYQSTLEDWSWYLVLPLLADVALIISAVLLREDPALALYIVGAAVIVLLIVGIRNAWDMVTFLAVERAHTDNKKTE